MDTSNYEHLRCRVSEAARDVLARTLTFEEAAAKYDVTADFIENKIKDKTWEPPRPVLKAHSVIDTLRQTPVQPRDVLTAEEKQLKDTFIDPQQKRRVWVMFLVCLQQAANEFSHNVLTLRAAAEKYDVKPEDVLARSKDAAYEPPRPLAPGEHLSDLGKQQAAGEKHKAARLHERDVNQAANAVTADILTITAACDKYHVTESEVQEKLKALEQKV